MTTPGAKLKAARLSQAMPETGQPWTQDYFLDTIAATGWRPAYANYLKTERGETQPKPATWKKFVTFWKSLGVDLDSIEVPDEAPAELPPATDVASALIALARAWEMEREENEARFRTVEAELRSLRVQLADAVSQARFSPQP